jgi:VCBS repeat-containing protein
LELTYSESLVYSVQQDIQNFKEFLSGGRGWFEFSSFDLRASGFEKLEVVLLDSGPVAPVAHDYRRTGDEDSAFSGNMFNSEQSASSKVAAVNGQSGNERWEMTLASGALLVVSADGSYTYDPNGKFESLGVGQTATDSFTYVAADSQGQLSNTATATLIINGMNDAAVAHDDSHTTAEGSALGGNVLINDADLDIGDTLRVSAVNGQSGNELWEITLDSGALLTVNADGTFGYDPNGQFEFLGVGQTATDSFSYMASDPHGLSSNPATATIAITGVNDLPVAVEDANTTDEDHAVAGNLLANDTDVDTGDTRTVISVNGQEANVGTTVRLDSGALLKVNADGGYTYDPNGQFEFLGAGETRTDTFTYRASDSHGASSDPATVSVTITGMDDAPASLKVAVIGKSKSAAEDTAKQLDDSSVFAIDAEAIALSSNSSAEKWSEALAGYDVVVVGSSGSFDAPEFHASQLFPALRGFVVDGGGVVTTGWFTYDLNNMYNSFPQFALDADFVSPVAPGAFNALKLGTTITVDLKHAITQGVTSYIVDAAYHEQATAIDAGATRLAGGSLNSTAIAYDEVGDGLTAYLGGLYLAGPEYNTQGLRSGTSDQLLEQAVAWAGGSERLTEGASSGVDDALGSTLLADADGVGGLQLIDFAADMLL